MIRVFRSFDPSSTKTAEEDIFFLNNLNVFIVNDQTLARSRATGRMAFECWYAVPELTGRNIVNEWRRAEIFLDDLTFSPEKQLVFYNDYLSQREALENSVNADVLRRDFHSFWMELGREDTPQSRERWVDLRERMAVTYPDIKLPNSNWTDPFQGGRLHSAERPLWSTDRVSIRATAQCQQSGLRLLQAFSAAIRLDAGDL